MRTAIIDIINFIGIPSLITTILLLFSKRYIINLVDHTFQQSLENHKHNLNLLTEKARFDYQRMIQDFNLFTTKKHECYIELHQLLLEAYGWIDSLYGLRSELTYEDYNLNDIINKMEIEKFPKGKIEEITEIWESNKKDIAINRMKEFMRLIEFKKTDKALIKARNFHFSSKLFLSESIENLSKKYLDNLHSIFITYDMLERHSGSRTSLISIESRRK